MITGAKQDGHIQLVTWPPPLARVKAFEPHIFCVFRWLVSSGVVAVLFHNHHSLSNPWFNLYGGPRVIVILLGWDWLREYEWYRIPKGSIVIFPSHGTKKCTLTHWSLGLSASSVLRHKQTLANLSLDSDVVDTLVRIIYPALSNLLLNSGILFQGCILPKPRRISISISISCIVAAFTIPPQKFDFAVPRVWLLTEYQIFQRIVKEQEFQAYLDLSTSAIPKELNTSTAG